MSDLIDITVDELERFNQEIKDTLSRKGIDTTGRASSSLRINVDEQKNSFQSIGVDYIEALDKGRGPGKFPPPDVIRQWVVNKPVTINPFIVGRKIAREGTEIFKDNSKGLQIDDKIEVLTGRIKERVPKGLKADILKKLNKFKLQREI